MCRVYLRVFDFVVARVNAVLGQFGNTVTIQVSVLDIFGFEVFKQNHFEQVVEEREGGSLRGGSGERDGWMEGGREGGRGGRPLRARFTLDPKP